MKKILRSIVFTALAAMLPGATIIAQVLTASITQQPCNNNGVISVSVTGMTPPISYTYQNWMAGPPVVHANLSSTTDALTNIAALNFMGGWNPNVWYIEASDGTNYDTAVVILNPAFTFTVNQALATCPALNTVQAVFSGGTSPFTVVWTNLSSNTSYTGNPLQAPNGNYSVVATDGAGCMVSSPTTTGSLWVQSNTSLAGSIAGSPANCTNGTATVTASGGTSPYSYSWSNMATSTSISGLSAGSYNCVITDAQGCQRTVSHWVPQAVTINYNSSVTHATCLQNDGAVLSFVTGGTAPYSFMWSNSATTQNLSGIPGGVYQVQITDVNGCKGAGSVWVNKSTPITVTFNTSASSCTAATGAATITPAGGTAPYTITWYTIPSGSGATIAGKPAGTYNFKVTDAVGCVQTGGAVIPNVSTLAGGITGGAIVCPATAGALAMQVTGSHPPFTYLWSTAATTSSLTSLPLGAYQCTVTDAAGCKIVKGGSVFQMSPISVNFSSTPVSCKYSTDGSATAFPIGGTSPYSYSWSNTQTGATATSLGMGFESVTVTDANGCQKSKSVYIGNSATTNTCFCTITGTVFADGNANCTQNAGEAGIANIQVHVTGFGYAYTNANGVYSFQVPAGNYTISQSVQQYYPLAGCQSNNHTLAITSTGNCTSVVNFANNIIPASDLRISTFSNLWPPVPGNSYSQKVIVHNDGTMIESAAKLGYRHDGQLSYNGSFPWTLVQQNATSYPNWYSITSGFPTLNPNGSTSDIITYNVPTNIPVNTAVIFQDTIAKAAPISTAWLTDYTPWNNVNYQTAYVVSSYDPNYKEVSPSGEGPDGDILHKDSVLTYVVHFQNTGSWYANKVVIVDTIDADLNILSLRPGYGTHKYITTINENRVATFTFDNIDLPWKEQFGDGLSSGLVTYSIKLKKNLPLGTKVTNKAAIYFDYNDPIITNTTINTLVKPVGIDEYDLTAVDGALYPNPATDKFTLALASGGSSKAVLRIYDLSGREVMLKEVTLRAGNNRIEASCAELQTGIYLVQLTSEQISTTKKLIIGR